MFQIIFNDVSAAELSALPKGLQLDILAEFNFLPEDLEKADHEKFGRLKRGGRKLWRYRARDYRIYFEKNDDGLLIHRVLHKNSLKDFLYRTKLPMAEDETLEKSAAFWELIDQRKQG
jgi:mRNA-degrading endonuclease RelE of RelBE toxin-antitoxin system